jgi:hypothetical protein
MVAGSPGTQTVPSDLVSPSMSKADWVKVGIQFLPPHMWANHRVWWTSLFKNWFHRSPAVQSFLGIDHDRGKPGRLAHAGLARKWQGRLFFGTLAVVTLVPYYIACIGLTLGEVITTSAPVNYNIIEPKQAAQRKALNQAIEGGQDAASKGVSAEQQMSNQLDAVAVDTATQEFRRVAVPSLVAEQRERVTRRAVAQASQVRARAAQQTMGEVGGRGL